VAGAWHAAMMQTVEQNNIRLKCFEGDSTSS